jgi:hypothetical protein
MTSIPNKELETMVKHGFVLSRMLAYSRRVYLSRRPGNHAVWNANVVTTKGKIWWGDLDLAYDSEKLQLVAEELQTDLYILYETDFRFDKENRPMSEVEKVAIKKFSYKPKPESTKQRLLSSVSKLANFFRALIY